MTSAASLTAYCQGLANGNWRQQGSLPLTNVGMEAAPEHDAATEDEEAEVDIGPALIADSKSPELILPGQRAIHHPACRPSLSFDSTPGCAKRCLLACEALCGSSSKRRPCHCGPSSAGTVVTLMAPSPRAPNPGAGRARAYRARWRPSVTAPAAAPGLLREDDA
jgi:hypothetical protein